MIEILPPTVARHAPAGSLPHLCRAYRTTADRQRAIAALRRRGYGYFIRYLDCGRPALTAAPRPAWVPASGVWID